MVHAFISLCKRLSPREYLGFLTRTRSHLEVVGCQQR